MARALVRGNIHTMTSPGARATAILWDDDRIALVGGDDEVRTEAQRRGIAVEDLQGKVVLPGFVDAHTHFVHAGIKHTRPDLRGTGSRSEALERVAAWLASHPEGPVVAEGWDEDGWGGDRVPTRADVDTLEGTRPVVLRRICGHKAVANGPALTLLRARWNDERVDLETGWLLEEPSLYLNEVLPASAAALDDAVAAACTLAHRLGVTTVGDYSQAPYRQALLAAAAAGRLTVRVASSIYVQDLEASLAAGFRTGRAADGASPGTHPDANPGTSPRMGSAKAGSAAPSPWLRDGGLKVFLDGSLGGHTALLRQPYADAPTHGRANWKAAEVASWFRRAHGARVQIHAHAIGDAAIDVGLEAFGQLPASDAAPPSDATQEPPDGPATALRHRFEHFEIVHDEQVARTAALGIVASSQPNFVGTWSGPGGMYETRLGPRFLLNNRFQTFRKAGIRLAFGSDGMPFGPLYGIQCAMEHPLLEQRLDAAQAVWHYTAEAAWSLHWDDVGTLQPGSFADLLILDVTTLDERPATEWVILETISGGVSRGGNTQSLPHEP